MHCTERRFVITSILALVAFVPAISRAQSTVETSPVLIPGDTVRVWAPTARLDGVMATFTRVSPLELVIGGQSTNPSAPPREWVVPFGNVVRVDVMRANRRSGRRLFAGILIGAAGGALVGAPLGPLIECGGACDSEGGLQPQVGYGVGAVIGAGVGAIIGGIVTGMRRTHWETVTFSVR
ncbi:MAG: hypothetical protein ABIR92_09510 [Gemmatimonadaceae bacterium]